MLQLSSNHGDLFFNERKDVTTPREHSRLLSIESRQITQKRSQHKCNVFFSGSLIFIKQKPNKRLSTLALGSCATSRKPNKSAQTLCNTKRRGRCNVHLIVIKSSSSWHIKTTPCMHVNLTTWCVQTFRVVPKQRETSCTKRTRARELCGT